MEARIFNHSHWIIMNEVVVLSSTLDMVLTDSKFSILGTIEHHFTPLGYTKLWLLGESHLALHSFPEEEKVYIELSSCSEEKFYDFWKTFYKWIVDQRFKTFPQPPLDVLF